MKPRQFHLSVIFLTAILLVSCSENDASKNEKKKRPKHEDLKISKVSIAQIAEAATSAGADSAIQIDTWKGKKIDVNSIRRDVSHLPKVLQKGEIDRVYKLRERKVVEAAKNNKSLNVLREVFLKSTNPDFEVIETRRTAPDLGSDSTEINFVKINYKDHPIAPFVRVGSDRSGVVNSLIIEITTETNSGLLQDARLISESIVLYPPPMIPPKPDSIEKGLDSGDVKVFYGIEMAWCPPGEFLRGSPEDEPGRDLYNERQHRVQLSKGFWMSMSELTQRQWLSFSDWNPSKHVGAALPISNLDITKAEVMVSRLNTVAPLPSRARWNIPTEAQWEYACRAGGDSVYRKYISHEANYGDAMRQYSAVRLKKPNSWGLYDMLGNVAEFCRDRSKNIYLEYDHSGIIDVNDSNLYIDPIQTSGNSGVVRGGSWTSARRACRPSARGSEYGDAVGIRLVVTID